MPLYAADLITRVREKADENNTESVSDASILRSLNEAQRTLVRIAARQFDQIFIDYTDLTTDGTEELTIPEAAFDRRIEFLELSINSGSWRRLRKEKPGRITSYRSTTQASYPISYTTKRDKILLMPSPIGGHTVRVWYTKRAQDLVKSSGRVVDFSVANGTLTLDSLSSDVTTDVDSLGAFINVIDSTTGLIKGSYQVNSAASDVITIKSTGLDRTTVLGNTIGTELASTIEKDDYVCAISGTCVSELLADYSDYVIQYAVVDVRRSLREDTTPDYAHLKDLERELETIWAGRETDNKVTAKNPHWMRKRTSYRRR
ncbi:hypothetical protein OAF54_00045 [bacterium]|nr:hypothetical protein [bacterium]